MHTSEPDETRTSWKVVHNTARNLLIYETRTKEAKGDLMIDYSIYYQQNFLAAK